MQIQGKKIAILATHGFEQSELEVPRDKLKEAGATVHVVSPERVRSKAGRRRTGADP
jgi:protease I